LVLTQSSKKAFQHDTFCQLLKSAVEDQWPISAACTNNYYWLVSFLFMVTIRCTDSHMYAGEWLPLCPRCDCRWVPTCVSSV